MRIAVISTASLPVPPKAYGGMERAIGWLVKGLSQREHEVLLVAKEGSSRIATAMEYGNTEGDFVELMGSWIRNNSIDVIIDMSHNKSVTMAFSEFPQINVWQVMRAHWDKNPVFISKGQAAALGAPQVPVIYYGLDQLEYPVNLQAGDYVLYMGAMTKEKRPHLAVEAARIANKEIVLAGPPYDESYKPVFKKLLDQDHVRYVGTVGGQEKIDILQGATCLCHPVGGHGWVEAGALVVLEAWSMGIPTVATPNGCLPEYIRAGRNGYLASDNPEDLADAIKRASEIKRSAVVASFDGAFLYENMAFEYEKLCQRVYAGEKWHLR